MLLVYVWLPFVLIAMSSAAGFVMGVPVPRTNRPDRILELCGLIALVGPLWIVVLPSALFVRWIGVRFGPEPTLPPSATAIGAATPEDVDRLCQEVSEGKRPCFLRPFPCGICGEVVGHQHPQETWHPASLPEDG